MRIKSKYSWLKHIDFMCIDLISLAIAFVISYRHKFGDLSFITQRSWCALLVIVLFINFVLNLLINPYSGIIRRRFYEEIARSAAMVIYNFLLACVFFYIFKVGEKFSREMLIYMYLFYYLFALVIKYVWKRLIFSGKIHSAITNPTRLYVVASKKNLKEVIRNASADDLPLYEVVGSCDESGLETFADEVIENNIGEVLIAVKPSLISKDDYHKLIDNGISVQMDIESIIGFQTEDQLISRIGVYKTLNIIGMYSFTPRQLFFLGIKRLFDIICGLLGCIVLIPIACVIKIAYLATGDKAKILYTQKRVGKDGKIINIYKFRSMVPNADEVLKEMLKDEKYRAEWEENQKFKNDPRITKVGKVLRKTSIDEFPQFINVLKGEMSLVGPRPLIEGELEAHGGLKLYQRVKPGITGWWGCNGRSNIDYRERLELEYFYVKHFSFYIDVLCIFRTIGAVFRRDGAE